jgi:hypothetical protein
MVYIMENNLNVQHYNIYSNFTRNCLKGVLYFFTQKVWKVRVNLTIFRR